ncbi:flagellar basal body-associated protein FliL [uncultured Cellulomonas sp.]|uniref:flagellar basal body-associated FliL family protein n=1 Tax=uncultured Cellulomonas sp. TaxID=189682 RepID=UPI00262E1184|nr:flagellar basal body-associated FliL family protein [uncultured Cellulomonas sp.]
MSSKPKIGSRGTAPAAAPAPAPAPAPVPRRKRLVVVLVVVLLAGAGAGYWFVLGPGAASGPATEEVQAQPVPGVVQTVEPVSINLADGRYLRIGLGLQLPAEIEEEIDPARALDRTISVFSGRSVDEVTSPEGRASLKVELTQQLHEAYEGEVLEVFFTEYVTQ